jgi:hypothetical protein
MGTEVPNKINNNARNGEANHRARLKEADIPKIRAAVLQGEKMEYLAHIYGVRLNNISEICNRKLWRHVPWWKTWEAMT